VLTSAFVLGLTDVDALTMSMSRGIGEAAQLDLAALGIAVGVLANTLLKFAVAIVFGNRRFRVTAGTALAALAIALAVSILLQYR
jgi:uncharacterized membrane protein (DUF4010 family)